ncbi:MAG: hypothetical protein F2571_01925 [Actinobacteria bacterium]|uniref:Unannotated protein n=1 Tax=freshwater metagenome TaxID=449393 RepID=A0A6J6FDF2_9ZZZZ|nr:hypothetical protein [Actinomycetota bacterium]
MKRKNFDKIVTAVGFGLAALLLTTAGLLNWGASFASEAVSSQLEAQEITFPAVTGNPDESADITKFFADNGDLILSNAAQAQMYADHYLGFHLSKMPTYAAASAANRAASAAIAANPNDPTLKAEAASKLAMVDTVFKGTMLRGTLLTAYAFGTLGSIAAIAALVSLAGALVMLFLSILGLLHIRRTPEDATI